MKTPNTLVGIGWMLITGFLFVGVTAVVRHLGSDMPAAQAAFLRYVIGLALILALFFYQGPKFPGGRLLAMYW